MLCVAKHLRGNSAKHCCLKKPCEARLLGFRFSESTRYMQPEGLHVSNSFAKQSCYARAIALRCCEAASAQQSYCEHKSLAEQGSYVGALRSKAPFAKLRSSFANSFALRSKAKLLRARKGIAELCCAQRHSGAMLAVSRKANRG